MLIQLLKEYLKIKKCLLQEKGLIGQQQNSLLLPALLRGRLSCKTCGQDSEEVLLANVIPFLRDQIDNSY